MPLLHPSIGVGGACIPLAGRYLASICESPMSCAAQASSDAHYGAVAHLLSGLGRVVFLGVGYKAATPYTPTAPAVRILRELPREVEVAAFAEPDEDTALRRDFPGVRLLGWPDEFGGHKGDALVIPVASDRARALTEASFRRANPYRMVLDNEGVLSHLPDSLWRDIGTDYRVPGRCGWLTPSVAP